MMAAPAGPQKAHEARYRLKACMKSLDLRIEGDARTVVEAPQGTAQRAYLHTPCRSAPRRRRSRSTAR